MPRWRRSRIASRDGSPSTYRMPARSITLAGRSRSCREAVACAWCEAGTTSSLFRSLWRTQSLHNSCNWSTKSTIFLEGVGLTWSTKCFSHFMNTVLSVHPLSVGTPIVLSVHPLSVGTPTVPGGPPRSRWSFMFFLGKIMNGGLCRPCAFMLPSTVTVFPRSSLVIFPTCSDPSLRRFGQVCEQPSSRSRPCSTIENHRSILVPPTAPSRFRRTCLPAAC